MTDVTLDAGSTGTSGGAMEHPRARRRGGVLPLVVAAILGFAFVLGFGGPGDPVAARVALALAAATAAAAILLLGQVLLTLVGRQQSEAEGALPTRERLETEKRQILLAIKELDFDRAMGKINAQDHAELKARYEAEAFRVLKAIDDERTRWEARAEEVARRHLKQHGLSMPPWAGPRREALKSGLEPDEPYEGRGEDADAPSVERPAREPRTAEAPAMPEAPAQQPAPAATDCPGCGTENDPDARFCKRCGARLTEAA